MEYAILPVRYWFVPRMCPVLYPLQLCVPATPRPDCPNVSSKWLLLQRHPIVLHDQAFADDISLISSSPSLAQKTINLIDTFLVWFRLQANPKKCIAMAMKKFDPRFVSKIHYERYGSTIYCPYDPELTIGGERLKFIVNAAADKSSLQYDHFKELGRFISVDLKEDKVKTEIRRRLLNDMETVASCGVNGLCKLFLYEHFVARTRPKSLVCQRA